MIFYVESSNIDDEYNAGIDSMVEYKNVTNKQPTPIMWTDNFPHL